MTPQEACLCCSEPQLFVFFFNFYYSQFTILCQFLMYSEVIWLYTYIFFSFSIWFIIVY